MTVIHPRRAGRFAAALALAPLLVAAGCSSTSSGRSSPDHALAATTADAGVATGPAASFAALQGGKGVSLLAASTGPDLGRAGYAQGEYAASGTAVAYAAAELPTSGRWNLHQTGSPAAYATRVLVRRPTDPTRFSGTVAVEWLNVSSGSDSAPDYTYMAAELLRAGDAWVGVSSQRIGIEGGPVAVAVGPGGGKGIKHIDPARYGKLRHPGDAYSYDLYTQVARGLRSSGPGNPLNGLRVERLLAVGESQSAFALTTYADGVQPITHAFDGFLIHSRGGAAAPLGRPGAGIDIAGTIGGRPTIIRTDLQVPTIMVETETDVLGLLGYLPARQDDTDRLRLWEMAGTAHADKVQVGAAEGILGCPTPVNRGQQAFVLRAALHDLAAWAAGRAAPPKAARLQVTGAGKAAAYERDAVGNVRGGVRTPAVDAPVDVLSGLPAKGASLVCVLFGQTNPIPAGVLAARYPSRAAYIADYAKATDAAITAGFVSAADRTELLAGAQPERVR